MQAIDRPCKERATNFDEHLADVPNAMACPRAKNRSRERDEGNAWTDWLADRDSSREEFDCGLSVGPK